MSEARKVIPIMQARPVDPEVALLKDGWQRQTTIGEPRLSEIAQNYRTMGFEVHVEEFKTEGSAGDSGTGDGGCNTCFDAGQEMGHTYGTVYIRKRAGAPAGEDELF